MLSELNIRDFAIIDELQVRFTEGLTVISGETGAGKSILIGAVGLLLGERASTDMIRSLKDEAVVEALFDIRGQKTLKARISEMGFGEADEIIIRRVVSRSGKNRVYINGRIGALSSLAEIGESLINICSQNAHQTILQTDNQIDILDEFGGLLPLREEYRKIYDYYRLLGGELRLLEEKQGKRAEREELLRYQIAEIGRAEILAGEDAALFEEKNILINIQKLANLSQSAYESLYSKGESVLAGLHEVVAAVKEIRKIDPSLGLSGQEMDEFYYRIEEAALTLRDYANHLTFDQLRLEAIEERLELLGNLKRKYGGTLLAVLEKFGEAKKEIEAISTVEYEITALAGRIAEEKKRLWAAAAELSAQRRQAASVLMSSVEDEIRSLRMDNARFVVVFQEREKSNGEDAPQEKGNDFPEFYLAANVGEELKPMRNVASGGELSRIMLAFKKVLATTGSVGTIVFDEVDSGIGGATAEIVGKRLQEVARSHQVICITHLPQIACRGERHYLAAKHVIENRTSASVSILSDDERVEEIARMLGGVELTKKTREHAREMLFTAR
ncbi:MAG: DNA repair protein RecN [Syntrophobacterales bacterium]|nr:DNA repair protein RecN [Syntrophobacterales bacterium]